MRRTALLAALLLMGAGRPGGARPAGAADANMYRDPNGSPRTLERHQGTVVPTVEQAARQHRRNVADAWRSGRADPPGWLRSRRAVLRRDAPAAIRAVPA